MERKTWENEWYIIWWQNFNVQNEPEKQSVKTNAICTMVWWRGVTDEFSIINRRYNTEKQAIQSAGGRFIHHEKYLEEAY